MKLVLRFLLFILIVLIIPIFLIKWVYPFITLNPVKFTEEYIKIIAGCILGIIALYISRILDMYFLQYKLKKNIEFNKNEYFKQISDILQNIDSESEFKIYEVFSNGKKTLTPNEVGLLDLLRSYLPYLNTKSSEYKDLYSFFAKINSIQNNKMKSIEEQINEYKLIIGTK